jgi:hypothetical protein
VSLRLAMHILGMNTFLAVCFPKLPIPCLLPEVVTPRQSGKRVDMLLSHGVRMFHNHPEGVAGLPLSYPILLEPYA